MSENSLFQNVKDVLCNRLDGVIAELLPGGRVMGREYVCGSLKGGPGDSCRVNMRTGVGSDFATGDTWSDIIGLAALVWNVRPFRAAQRLAEQYGVSTLVTDSSFRDREHPVPFTYIVPVPISAPEPPRCHPHYGMPVNMWRYTDKDGYTLAYTARFNTAAGKVVLPLCYGCKGGAPSQWHWKALPKPRPLYNLVGVNKHPESPVLIVEGEKTADAAQHSLPEYVALTWSGGAKAVDKTDFSPIFGRNVTIWPDNDAPGFRAALDVSRHIQGKVQSCSIVLPPMNAPEGWDVADTMPTGHTLQDCLRQALSLDAFFQAAYVRFPQAFSRGMPGVIVSQSQPKVEEDADTMDDISLNLKVWPVFSFEACPGLLGDFVNLATRDSEADPAAVCITALVRFCAEVYGLAPGKGPHVHVGETIHPPRLFAVICGNSSKARKGTSRYPVTRLFARDLCIASELYDLRLPPPARESGGPLSTGEGLAYYVRDVSDTERERQERDHPDEPQRDKYDKRLVILDEEFASGLACTKREGNTLSMGIRCFWDSGDYAPLTKNNPIRVHGAHINILTHITMQELAVCLGDVQAFNGFGNRFLWICARRSKLVPLPPRMEQCELARIQRELWRLVSLAQRRGAMCFTDHAMTLWEQVYPWLSQEHMGLVGSIINRAEAQTIRLALVYALLDGQDRIDDHHLRAALALWRYAQDSAVYIFDERAADPLEEKILMALRLGPLTATQLSAALNRNVPRERLQPVLQQLEAQRRIIIQKIKGEGRPKILIARADSRTKTEIDEKNETTPTA